MNLFVDRINTPVSDAELKRRWTLVRTAMEEQRIDALIMQATNDHMGGYVKYFTDIPATWGYPFTVIFPRDEDMTLITHGALNGEIKVPPEGDGLRRGVERVLTAPTFVSATYSLAYDADLAAKVLKRYTGGTVGLVGTGTLPVSLIDPLRQGVLAKTQIIDATEMVDRIKCVKSEEEIALIRRTAALQDAAIEAAFAAIKPGMHEYQVAAIAEYTVLRGGGEQGLYLCSRNVLSPAGQPVWQAGRHQQNGVLCEGDVFTLLVESNGPGGLYAEIGRTCVLGKVPQELQENFEFLLKARQHTLDLLKPGASCADIWQAHNKFMREHGRPDERRLYCHGQGYDLVERPLVRQEEPMPILANMNIACHPNYLSRSYFITITDNYLVGANGVTEHLHKCSEKIFELG